MSYVVPVLVECSLAGKRLANYEMGYARTLGPSAPPLDASLIDEAKSNLTNEGLAWPPYAGVQFKVVRRR